MHYTGQIAHTHTSDIIVVGAGSAGCAAALAAARGGARVIIIERYGFAGGTGAQVLDTFYGYYTPGTRRKVIGGIPDQIVAALRARSRVIVRPNTYGAGDGITYDPEALKSAWEHELSAAGVTLLYHALVIDVCRHAGQPCGVIVASRGGLMQISGRVIIDASGDADVAAAAGAPWEGPARGAPAQSATTTFRLFNVDTSRAQQVSRSQLHQLMAEAIDSGGYALPRREGSIHITPLAGAMVANMTRVRDVDATDPWQLSAAEQAGRRQALEYVRFLQERVPGYEHAVLGNLSVQLGIRESRRIIGEYRLSRADVLDARQFDDGVALCGAPIEEHHGGADTRWEYLPAGAVYGIPYRCLVPQHVDGLLVAGRCLSADHDAHASVRSMGQCMAMGQAAGTAAALTLRLGCTPRDLAPTPLRDALRASGAIIDASAIEEVA
jgi:glycine/D-amino acid oxidase-like deaminating enzyme